PGYGLLPPLSSGKQTVVSNVLGESVLESGDTVLTHSRTDVRAVDHLADSGGTKCAAISDAGQLEQLRSGERTGTQNNFTRGGELHCLSVSAGLDSDGSAVVDDDSVDAGPQCEGQVGTIRDRVEEGVGRAPATAAADRRHRKADPLPLGVIVVGHPVPAHLDAGLDDIVKQLFASTCGGDVQRTVAASGRGRSERMCLDGSEGREHVLPPPSVIAECLESFVIGPLASVVHHPVDRAGPAEGLAPHPVFDLLVRSEGTGRVVPDGLGIAEQLPETAWNRDQRIVPVTVSGFDKQDAGLRVGGETIGEHTPRRACTDDDIVKAIHQCFLLTTVSPLAEIIRRNLPRSVIMHLHCNADSPVMKCIRMMKIWRW